MSNVLVVFAHPDDAEFYCAGTVLKFISQGHKVYYVVATDGSKGTLSKTLTSHELAQQRRQEQLSAANVLGVSGVHFLDYSDGELEPSVTLMKQIAYFYRTYKPEIVLTFHPSEKIYDMHPDHYAAGLCALRASLFCELPLFYSIPHADPLPSKTIKEFRLFSTGAPTHTEDVSSVLDKKLAALQCHQTQLQFLMDAQPHYIDIIEHPEHYLAQEPFLILKGEVILK